MGMPRILPNGTFCRVTSSFLSSYGAPPIRQAAANRPSPYASPGRSAVDSLFRRFAVEVLVVGFRVAAGMVDDSVPMVRGRIERIELQRNSAGINDVVICPCRDDYREARSDRFGACEKNSGDACQKQSTCLIG
jgi:hypothetical protein